MPAAAEHKPRYRELADDLRAQIVANAFAAPDQFPTESVLCARYGVSRFTVREALRALQGEGLIQRRRGSGTVIQPAAARGGALHQPLSNFDEILQYARDTRIRFDRLAPAPLPARLAEEIGPAASVAGRWARFAGVRTGAAAGDPPIAVIAAYVHPALAAATTSIDLERNTLFRQVEELTGARIARVTQDIFAVAASAPVAAALGVARRSPCLRILRCYIDADARVIEISDSHHPAGSFAYSMHIEVDGG